MQTLDNLSKKLDFNWLSNTHLIWKLKIKIWKHQGPKHKTESNMKCEIKKILKLNNQNKNNPQISNNKNIL